MNKMNSLLWGLAALCIGSCSLEAGPSMAPAPLGMQTTAPTQEGCSMEEPRKHQPPGAWDCPWLFHWLLIYSAFITSLSALVSPWKSSPSACQSPPLLWFSHTVFFPACFDSLSLAFYHLPWLWAPWILHLCSWGWLLQDSVAGDTTLMQLACHDPELSLDCDLPLVL